MNNLECSRIKSNLIHFFRFEEPKSELNINHQRNHPSQYLSETGAIFVQADQMANGSTTDPGGNIFVWISSLVGFWFFAKYSW
jgi:hypothetical protein